MDAVERLQNDLYCSVCLVPFNGHTPAQQHYTSEKHKKKVALANRHHSVNGGERNKVTERNVSAGFQPIPNSRTFIDVYPTSERQLVDRETDEIVDCKNLIRVIGVAHGGVASALASSRNEICTTGTDLSTSSHISPVNGFLPSYQYDSEEKEYEFDDLIGTGKCNVCNVHLTSKRLAQQHLNGKKHLTSSRQWRTKQEMCQDRNTSGSSTAACSVSSGLVSDSDSNGMRQATDENESEINVLGLARCEVLSASEAVEGDRTVWHKCDICSKRLNSVKQLEIHKISHNGGNIATTNAVTTKLQSTPVALLKGNADVCIGIPYQSTASSAKNCTSEIYTQSVETSTLSGCCEENCCKSKSDPETCIKKVKLYCRKCDTLVSVQASHSKSSSAVTQNIAEKALVDCVINSSAQTLRKDPSFGAETTCDSDKLFDSTSISPTSVASPLDCMVESSSSTNPSPFKYNCKPCNAVMNSEKTRDSHMRSQRHLAIVAKCAVATERPHPDVVREFSGEQCMVMVSEGLVTSQPRHYQVELFVKAMASDSICFLPTGTGKTLVAIMVMSAMLKTNISRSVIFLVEKVLLASQQFEVIKKELGSRVFERWNEEFKIVELRPLRIALLSGDKEDTGGHLVSDSDVIVATAAYYANLVMTSSLLWTDNSLVIMDEVHHCVKSHPYHRLITSSQHSQLAETRRPKFLGLTASPAGQATVPATVEMLKRLLNTVGPRTVLATVRQASNIAELDEFRSNTQLEIRLIAESEFEARLQSELKSYLVACCIYLTQQLKAAPLERLPKIFQTATKDHDVRLLDQINGDVTEELLSVLNSDALRRQQSEKVKLFFILQHMTAVCDVLLSLEALDLQEASQTLSELAGSQFGGRFELAIEIGLPCEKLEALTRSTLSKPSLLESADNECFFTLFHCVLSEIENFQQDSRVHTRQRQLSLILVRTRRVAKLLSEFLTEPLQQLGLRTTFIVGHGTNVATGQKVSTQRRIVEEIRRGEYQVIVATNVAEEGVDFPLCHLVVAVYPPDSVTTLVQMRGRARRKGSRFVAICRTREAKAAFESLLGREQMMMEAVRQLM